MNALLLSELICTRINHDIIGNAGAVANATELLDEGDMDFIEDINKILKTSSFTLNARLKFFRLAFGMDNAAVGSVSDLSEVAKNYVQTVGSVNHPIRLEFSLNDTDFYKPALLSVMIGADVFIKGGMLKISQTKNGLEMLCRSEAGVSLERIAGIKAILDGDSFEPNAKFAPVYYLQELLINRNYNIYVVSSESFGISITRG